MSNNNTHASVNFGPEQGARLRFARKTLDLTPEQAATKAKVSSQQWRKYERGESEPGVSKMIFLFQEGFSLNWIMTGEGPARAGEASAEADQTAQQVDAELLAEIIAGVMDFLTEDNREMVPDKMAELIAALYEMYSCSGKNVDKQNIIRLIKAAA